MARLAAIEKGLYYPTPDSVLFRLSERFKFEQGLPGSIRMFDPCAGTGEALQYLANHAKSQGQKVRTYGIELEQERAGQASQVLDKVICDAFENVFLTPESMDLVFLNPPYDEGNEHRQEIEFLQMAVPLVAPSGVLVYIVPERIVKHPSVVRLLADFSVEECVQFPKGEYERFQQVLLIAKRSRYSNRYYYYVDLWRDTVPSWVSPVVCSAQSQIRAVQFTQITEHSVPSFEAGTGVFGTPQWAALVPSKFSENRNPLCAPRTGHQAMMLASGILNGAQVGDSLVKGRLRKTEVVRENIRGNTREVVTTEKLITEMSLLNLETGEIETWDTNKDTQRTIDWFEQHKIDLRLAIAKAYTPEFDGDISPHLGLLSRLTPPGVLPGESRPKFLPLQVETAAAIAHRWKNNPGALLSGEMGLGKTVISILACEMSKAKKTIVICPSHLVPKWVREVNTILGGDYATTAKKLSEVDDFFQGSRKYLVLSKETAKLGAKWQTQAEKRGGNLSCPHCGTLHWMEGARVGSLDLVTKKTKCSQCKTPMWEFKPISEKGTKRWALARYINKRYHRKYHLVVDECHAFKSGETDQSKAVTALVSQAIRTVMMTGTIYAGKASSIFQILYRIDPSFRDLYRYDEVAKFVAHHGLFEKRSKEENYDSVYGYHRGKAKERIKEIPGMSPAMIPMILPYTTFVRLKDLEYALPEYHEHVERIELNPNVLTATLKLEQDLKGLIRTSKSAVSNMLMSGLGYPDCPEQGEDLEIEIKGGGSVKVTAPQISEEMEKDLHVLQLVQNNVSVGRKCLVYMTQTHRRDARPRLKALLEQNGLRVSVLDSNVAPDKRIEWLIREEKKGFDVLLTNGKLVETGMDLMFASTIIQYGVEYSINTLRQSVRRSWRLGQREPIHVHFLAYQGTMQERAVDLIAKKMRAAELVDGDELGGLAQEDTSADDLVIDLARSIFGAA